MNLKFYLRGLGLGIIVATIILSVHFHTSSKNNTMTDAQIRERAAQLGMVDGNSRLVDNDDVSAEELLEQINSSDNEETTSVDSPEIEETVQENQSDDVDNADTSEQSEQLEQTIDDAREILDDMETVNNDVEIENTTETEPVETVTNAADDPDGHAESITFTIASGDSSYSVAKKLVAAGIVPDASDYDAYLCSHGYDRYIRTGTYQISKDASNEDIAKMITGK